MVRHIARAATLGLGLIFAATALRAQDQKGTLVFAVESLGAQTLDPILEGRPGNAVYQAVMYDSLVGFNLAKGGIAQRREVGRVDDVAEGGGTRGGSGHLADPFRAPVVVA